MKTTIMLSDKQLTAIVNAACLQERKGRKFILAHVCDEVVIVECEGCAADEHEFIAVEV